MKSVNCSDWMRGWGFGGDDHIGKLYKNGENSYEWIGIRQGRHNNIIRGKHKIIFKVLENGTFEFDAANKTNWLPDRRDVNEAIRILNIPEPVKRIKSKKITNTNQSLLFQYEQGNLIPTYEQTKI